MKKWSVNIRATWNGREVYETGICWFIPTSCLKSQFSITIFIKVRWLLLIGIKSCLCFCSNWIFCLVILMFSFKSSISPLNALFLYFFISLLLYLCGACIFGAFVYRFCAQINKLALHQHVFISLFASISVHAFYYTRKLKTKHLATHVCVTPRFQV